MGTTKPKNELFLFHDEEADHHVKYKQQAKQQIYNDKRAIKSQIITLKKQQQQAEEKGDREEYDIAQRNIDMYQEDPVLNLDSDNTVHTEVTDEENYELLLYTPFQIRDYDKLQIESEKTAQLSIRKKQLQTVFKRNKFYDEEGNEAVQSLVLICEGVTFKNEKVKLLVSN